MLIEPEIRLLEFLKGNVSNYHQKTIYDIWAYDTRQLEKDHHYIQWLFPLTTKSKYNLLCPKIKHLDIFQNRIILSNMKSSFSLMLHFYGLEYKNGIVSQTENYKKRLSDWCTKDNHNYKRITRILHSLVLFGLVDEATAFYDKLVEIYNQNQDIIGSDTFRYWTQALEKG